MPKKTNVVIVGAGDIGQAIAHLVDRARANVEMWDVQPGLVPDQQPLDKIIAQARVVFFCVPSWVLHSAVTSCLPHLPEKATVISITKGIEPTTKKTMDEFWPLVLPPGQSFALLLGPMLAKEIRENLGGIGLVASTQRAPFALLSKIFTSQIKLEFSRDVRGAAWASVIKNVYALVLGIADGLNWGGNRRGLLAAQSVNEMMMLLKHLGVKKNLAFSPAGLPDLLATGFSPYSHNRTSGSELVATGECIKKSEGLVSYQPLIASLGEAKNDFPLLATLEKALLSCTRVKEIFEDYYTQSA